MRQIIVFIIFFSFFSGVKAQSQKKPKLVVGIVVDQMCYEYLYRFQDRFSKKGFLKLMERGTNCRNARYNYVPTFTGPGHASIYTGTTPENHGIVANDWFDRLSNQTINCVGDASVKSVGTSSEDGLCSPIHLKTTTITDQLKMTYPNSKVISMSIKDRGAILPGGHLSDGSYWYDYATGQFITSSYFDDKLPDWVKNFNGQKQVDNYLEQTWNTLYDLSTYKECGPDNSPYEITLSGKTNPTFPYNLKEMCGGKVNYELFTITPFANTYLTDFALNSIASEKLGKDAVTDMLCISYSTPDIVGHAFGPYSVELEDVYLRLDKDLERLITTLEKEVGKNEFVLFLTADHAVVPVPQDLKDRNLPGGYFFLNERMTDLKSKVKTKFGEDFVLGQNNMNIYLDRQAILKKQFAFSDVSEFIAEEIRTWQHVKRVFTADDLMKSGSDDEWRDMIRKGYHPAESGDIIFMLESGYLGKSLDTPEAHKGTSHGSAFNYDTHVPLLWYGKGIPKQEIFRLTEITDIAPTLTNILNLQRSGSMTGEPILELFR
jgi:predicted AlkP superfamily pyrophosphatase or phosphodiesterase